ncbi:Nn.00g059320.m01.CDS01 [Neocucurbitaria sp. VM-36]
MESSQKTTTKDHHRYDALHNVDAHSDSSTEVDEADWDPEHDIRPRQRRRKTCWQRTKRYRWILDTTLLLIIVALLVEKRWTTRPRSPHFELAGDITGFAPAFSKQIVTFKPDPVFAPENASEFWSKETKEAWLGLVPEGLGYVSIPNPTAYTSLPHPLHDYLPTHTVYTTAVTHQLHCLYTILEAYNSQKLLLQNPQSPPPLKSHFPWHTTHCFEYLRHSILCAADVALEGAASTFPLTEGGEDRGGSDGWDSRHVCRDYEGVKGWLEERAVSRGRWISSDG